MNAFTFLSLMLVLAWAAVTYIILPKTSRLWLDLALLGAAGASAFIGFLQQADEDELYPDPPKKKEEKR